VARIDWSEPGLGSLEAVPVEAGEVPAAPLARSAAVAAEAWSAMVD
jgi:hypothetical protein